MYYLARYRRKVVRKNLELSFPEKSSGEIITLEKKFYHHLCDIMLESLKAFSMNDKEMISRYWITNPELINDYFLKEKSVIVVTGHYNNWEWGSIAACLQLKHHPIGFYKPIKNECIDNYMRGNRERNGAKVVSITKTSESFQLYKSEPALFLMVADQSPSKIELAHWRPFLNRETAFLHGPEKHARLNNLPVVYAGINKVKRGYYSVAFQLLTENPAEVPEEGITGLFAEALEKTIRRQPEYWLWSHKRWKHERIHDL